MDITFGLHSRRISTVFLPQARRQSNRHPTTTSPTTECAKASTLNSRDQLIGNWQHHDCVSIKHSILCPVQPSNSLRRLVQSRRIDYKASLRSFLVYESISHKAKQARPASTRLCVFALLFLHWTVPLSPSRGLQHTSSHLAVLVHVHTFHVFYHSKGGHPALCYRCSRNPFAFFPFVFDNQHAWQT